MKTILRISEDMKHSLAVAFVATVYFCAILPVQSYMANANVFSYTLAELLFALSWRSFCVFVTLSGALFALSFTRLRSTSYVLVLALVMAAVVESTFLSVGLPQLNGDFSGYHSVVRAFIDVFILAFILIVPICFRKRLVRYVNLWAILLLVYVGVSLFDVKRDSNQFIKQDDFIVSLMPREKVVGNVVYSSSNNVVLLILDSVSVNAARDIMSDADFSSHFDGFVNYTNNLGVHWYTIMAIPAIMTGRPFSSFAELAHYTGDAYREESFIKPYLDADIVSFVNLAIGKDGYTNYSCESNEDICKQSGDKTIINSKMMQIFPFDVVNLSIFRILPYCLKESYANSIRNIQDEILNESSEVAQGRQEHESVKSYQIGDDGWLWPFLARRAVTSTIPKTLQIHHSQGGHFPIDVDGQGKKVNIKNPTYEDYKGKCFYALRNLANLFDEWKKNGVYDVSTIVVTADHGVGIEKPGVDNHGCPSEGFPFLMVKPRNAHGPLESSDIPTSHLQIAPLFSRLLRNDLDRNEIEGILSLPERFCRKSGAEEIIDWVVASNRNVSVVRHADTERDEGSIKPLDPDVEYGFSAKLGNMYPDFVMHGGSRGSTGGLSFGKKLETAFRIPKHCVPCDMTITAVITSKGDKENGLVAKCGDQVVKVMGEALERSKRKILFRSIWPSPDGIVRISFERVNDAKAYFCLKYLLMSAAKDSTVREVNSDQQQCSQQDSSHLGGANESLSAQTGDEGRCLVKEEGPLQLPSDGGLAFEIKVSGGESLIVSGKLSAGDKELVNPKWAVVLVKFLNESGEVVFSPSKLVYSKQFKSQFFYPYGKRNDTLEFSREIQVPVGAASAILTVKRFLIQGELSIRDFGVSVKNGD